MGQIRNIPIHTVASVFFTNATSQVLLFGVIMKREREVLDGDYDILLLSSGSGGFLTCAVLENLLEESVGLRVAVLEDSVNKCLLSRPHIILKSHNDSMLLLNKFGARAKARSVGLLTDSSIAPEAVLADLLNPQDIQNLVSSMRNVFVSDYGVTFIGAKVLGIDQYPDESCVITEALYYGKSKRLIRLRSSRVIALGGYCSWSQVLFNPPLPLEIRVPMLGVPSSGVDSRIELVFAPLTAPWDRSEVDTLGIICSNNSLIQSVMHWRSENSSDAPHSLTIRLNGADAMHQLFSECSLENRKMMILQELYVIMQKALDDSKGELSEPKTFIRLKTIGVSENEGGDTEWDYCDKSPNFTLQEWSSAILFYTEDVSAMDDGADVSEDIGAPRGLVYFDPAQELSSAFPGTVQLEAQLRRAVLISKAVLQPELKKVIVSKRSARKKENNPPLDIRFALLFVSFIVGLCCIFLAVFELLGAYFGDSRLSLLNVLRRPDTDQANFLSTCDASENAMKYL